MVLTLGVFNRHDESFISVNLLFYFYADMEVVKQRSVFGLTANDS